MKRTKSRGCFLFRLAAHRRGFCLCVAHTGEKKGRDTISGKGDLAIGMDPVYCFLLCIYAVGWIKDTSAFFCATPKARCIPCVRLFSDRPASRLSLFFFPAGCLKKSLFPFSPPLSQRGAVRLAWDNLCSGEESSA